MSEEFMKYDTKIEKIKEKNRKNEECSNEECLNESVKKECSNEECLNEECLNKECLNESVKKDYSQSCGNLCLIFGPMFSGKSTTLSSMVSEQEAIGQKVLFVNSTKDNRNPENDNTIFRDGIVTTHNHRINISKKTTYIKVDKIKDIPITILKKFNVIAVDEAQFFDDLTELIQILLYLKKIIFVAGLMATSEGKLFGKMHQLIPYAEKIEQKGALCKMCYVEKNKNSFPYLANMTFCLEEKKEETLVGSNQYVPMCLSHWNYSNYMMNEGKINEIKEILKNN
jgi:thymidine kinase